MLGFFLLHILDFMDVYIYFIFKYLNIFFSFKILRFLDIFQIFLDFLDFVGFFPPKLLGSLLKVTKVTSEDQKWPKKGHHSIKSRKPKPIAVARSWPALRAIPSSISKVQN